MRLDGEQLSALRELANTGVISAEQEQAVRSALDRVDVRPSGSRAERLVELIGYLGGGLLLGGAVLLVGTSWEDLPRVGRFALLAATTAVLVIAGVAIAGGPRAVRALDDGSASVRRRVVGVLFALSSGTTALAAGVAVQSRELLTGSTIGLVVAVSAYAVLPTAVGLLAPAVLSTMAVGALVVETSAARPLTMGLALYGLGTLWLVLAITRVIGHRPLGLAIGAVIALFGAQQPFGQPDTSVWSYAMTSALALACFVAYLRDHTGVLLVAGVVATTVVVPEAVWDWTDGAVSGGWLLLVGGSVLLAASGIGLRLRQGTRSGV